ncbi:polyhydroxyalkanoate granule-associated phasin [uncultured Xylophilus sp.]|uniref:polyhydroxyalkanoate granule-associated phasin n=1 Tax=uncultured Xylophilus sp. TaxID=296832 RepID=UPI0025EEB766|nr:polyhydroxyalkanoate granule-associated phasin [uncultured Xylophilus sp.]
MTAKSSSSSSSSSRRRGGASQRLMAQSAEMAMAVPQVMAHRLTRMALAGNHPSARDRKEFDLMSAEKVAAFGESWAAMGMEMFKAQQAMGVALAGTWAKALMGTTPSMAATLGQMQSAALQIAAAGMQPVHRRAVANSRRLRTTSLF